MTIDRDKLGKVLALLASDQDGEALAATRKAVELLAKDGMRPEDLARGLLPVREPDSVSFRQTYGSTSAMDDLARAMAELNEVLRRQREADEQARTDEETWQREAKQARREWEEKERKRKAEEKARDKRWHDREREAGRDFDKPYVFHEPLPNWRKMTVAAARRHLAYLIAEDELTEDDARLLNRIAARLNATRPRRPSVREIPRLNALWQAMRERTKPAPAEPQQKRKRRRAA